MVATHADPGPQLRLHRGLRRGGRPGDLARRDQGAGPLRGPLGAAHLGLPDPGQHRQEPRREGAPHPAVEQHRRRGRRAEPGPGALPVRRRGLPGSLAGRARGMAGRRRRRGIRARGRGARRAARGGRRAAGAAADRADPERRPGAQLGRGVPACSRSPRPTSGCCSTGPAPLFAQDSRPTWRGAEMAELGCQELVELVTEYLEGTLDPRDRRRIAQHLGECDALRPLHRADARDVRACSAPSRSTPSPPRRSRPCSTPSAT